MSKSRERLWIFALIAAVASAGFAWLLVGVRDEGRTRVHYEDLALARLRLLAEAETAFLAKRARFGWVDELEREELLTDFGFERGAGGGAAGETYLTSPRYRLDVLLPHTVTRENRLAIALKSAGKRNPDLERLHYAAVARPWGDGLTGYRTFCIDESGQVYVSEGVSDERSRTTRPLPELHLTRERPIVTGGLRWYPIDDLPKR